VLLGLVVLLGSASLLLNDVGGALRLGPLGPREQLDIVKISLSIVAGIGGVIALTVAYRKQKLGEAAHGREEVKLFTERFGACVAQLGDESPAVRLGGVYALAHLADDWETGRQTCIEVLCAQLRMPYPADQPNDPEAHATFLAFREVRYAIWRIIGDHLRPGATQRSWEGYNFNFTGALIDGVDLHGAVFSGGVVDFSRTTITGKFFLRACVYSGARVLFDWAEFSDVDADFDQSDIYDGSLSFLATKFISGSISFFGSKLVDGKFNFSFAEFSGADVYFFALECTAGTMSFVNAEFPHGGVWFESSDFCGSDIPFVAAKFCGAYVCFNRVKFCGSNVSFERAEFSGSEVPFTDATFSAGLVDLSSPGTYSRPPILDPSVASCGILALPESSAQTAETTYGDPQRP